MEEKRKMPQMELRSEKMRRIIGNIPNGLVYWGTTIIVVIFAILVAVVMCIPYPYSNGESIFRHIFIHSFAFD
jgi:hypothetical protein